MSQFKAGYTVFKIGSYPANLASNVGHEVLYVLDTAVKLKGFEATVSEHLLESIADRAKRRVPAEVAALYKTVDEIKVTKPIKEKTMTKEKNTLEHTGGSSSYYDTVIEAQLVDGKKRKKTVNVLVSCNSIIEALNMNYAQATIFKAVWRICASLMGKKKRGNNTVYDAEKIVFFADRNLIQEKKR